MHGHLSQIDKCCPPEWITATQVPYTHPPKSTFPPVLLSPQLPHAQATSTSIVMSSYSQTTGGPSSDDESPPILIFELNQARRAKVAREFETLRRGM
jgi:hypothetical protein